MVTRRVLPVLPILLTMVLVWLPDGPPAQERDDTPTRQGEAGRKPEKPPAGEASLPLYVIREAVETRLVLVPVTVTDKRRRSITDLQPHEFQLRIDREIYPIATFDPPVSRERPADGQAAGVATDPEGQLPPGAAAAAHAAAARRHRVTVAIVIDLFQTHLGHMRSGFLAVREYLDGGLPPEVEVGLFALSHGHLTRLTAFSHDTSAHLEALERLEENHAARDTWMMEEEFRQGEVRDAIVKGRELLNPNAPPHRQRSGAAVHGNQAGPLHLQPAEAAVHGNATEQSIRVGQVLDSLQSLAAAMSRLPGRKTVVFVGDGVREQAGLNYAIGAFDLQRFSVSMREPFRATGRIFKRSGVAFSPVSLVGVYNPGPEGPRRTGEAMGRMDYSDPYALDELIGSMSYLAKITGGRRPIAINDFTGEVASAVSQPLRSYVLGFVPLPVRTPGTIHQISVRVSRPGMVISARTEYVEQRPGLDSVELMDGAAVLPDEFRDLALTAELRILPAPDDMVEVHIQSRFSPSLLAWTRAREGRRAASIQFNGLLRRRSGQVLEIFRSAYALNFDPQQPPRTLVFQATETVPASDLEDVVLVATDMTSGKVGTAVIPVRVPVPVPTDTRDEKAIPISAPVYLAPAAETHLLTSTREPVLGVRLWGSLYLPTEPPLSGPGPVLVMARVVDPPDGVRVRFCLRDSNDRCLQARLQPDPEPVAGTEPTRSWAAWISLAEDVLPEVDGLRVEISADTAPAAEDDGAGS